MGRGKGKRVKGNGYLRLERNMVGKGTVKGKRVGAGAIRITLVSPSDQCHFNSTFSMSL